MFQLTSLKRVFTYATAFDFASYAGGAIAAIGAGITMPLMTVLFGKSRSPRTPTFSFSTGAVS